MKQLLESPIVSKPLSIYNAGLSFLFQSVINKFMELHKKYYKI